MTSQTFIAAIDQGTTSTRCILFDPRGQILATSQEEHRQIYPQPGWVEHDPDEIWTVTRRVLADALGHAGIGCDDLAAIGITNQRETVVLWDRRSGRPVHRAIVWQDRRTADDCARLREAGHEDTVRRKTGLVIDPYFSATKVAWLLDHGDGLRARGEAGELAFGTVDAWLVWNLTGGRVHATDLSNASRTLLFDIRRLAWDDELLELFRVPRALLPEVRDTAGDFGRTAPGLVSPSRPIPIGAVAGDQQAALFGQACFTAGRAKNTYGTGSFLLMNSGARPVESEAGLLATVAWRLPGEPACYALEGSIFVTGAAIQWLRDGLGLIGSAAETEALALSLAGNDGVYFVPALAGLGAPYWDAYARGAVLGLTRGTSRAHLVRAALESIAYQTRDVALAMARDARIGLADLRADGGAVANRFLMQFQADILGVPVSVPDITETTALGAAYLAGLGTGVWRSVAEIESHWRLARRYLPAMAPDDRDRLYRRWQRAVDRSRHWAREDGA
jgi:glycerol kinase